MKPVNPVLDIIFSLVLFTGAVFYSFGFFVPETHHLVTENPATSEIMQFRKKQFASKGRLYTAKIKWRRLKNIPRAFQKAVIYNEDSRFYQHNGVDWFEFRNAIEDFIRTEKQMRGASTITQQVAKNLFLNPQRSIFRKINEFWIAKRLEKELSKQRILEIYLNIAEWGPGIFGCEAASEYWFGTTIDKLNIRQLSLLASMLPAPLLWSPLKPDALHLKRTKKTMNHLKRIGFAAKSGKTLARPLDHDSSATQVSKQLQEARKRVNRLSPDSLIP